MKNKIQKWYKVGDSSWEPMDENTIYSLPGIGVEYYWTPAGKHPVEIMELEKRMKKYG
tara:strand:- start:421 stop:594 length:174 start_codon:yes stop_codon:yes gene_type:complete